MSAAAPPLPAALHARAEARREELLADLAALVALETPSEDPAALAEAARWLSRWLAPLGTVAELPGGAAAPHLLLTTPGATASSPLLLCHYDTVWPRGTTAERPFALQDGVATGPGLFDMKAGIVCARHALALLQELGVDCPARLSLTPDEEIGNRGTRPAIERLAAAACAALVLEPPLDDGRLKTARKGHGTALLEIEGRAAHAGVDPGAGVNAIEQAAAVVGSVAALAETVPGATVNVGRIAGGGPLNVVPERAEVELELRAWSAGGVDRLAAGLRALRTPDPRARIAATVVVDRPPLERTPAAGRLLEACARLSRPLGLDVAEGRTGGCSEGNLTAAAGAPTLDGLGVRGAGAHTREEWIDVDHLLRQTAVVAALVAELAGSRDG